MSETIIKYDCSRIVDMMGYCHFLPWQVGIILNGTYGTHVYLMLADQMQW